MSFYNCKTSSVDPWFITGLFDAESSFVVTIKKQKVGIPKELKRIIVMIRALRENGSKKVEWTFI